MNATISRLTARDITWHVFDRRHVGVCSVAWCDGLCEQPQPGDTRINHGRDIAMATLNGERLLEVSVGQDRPVSRWRDSATRMYPNMPGHPTVGFFWTDDEERGKGVFLGAQDAAHVADILTVLGEAPQFVEVLRTAITLMRAIEADDREAVRKWGVPPENVGASKANGRRVRAVSGSAGGAR